ncbi:hypothetical protein DFH11DRAFT_1504238 [Phellopilus nigrolimitatus]|nr:hypothetical protein DFH11DRAFT_1504238 [Phellopilus nigrolimitatus]
MLPANPRSGRSLTTRRPAASQSRSVSRPRVGYSEETEREPRGRTQQDVSIRPQRSMSNVSLSRTHQSTESPPPLPRQAHRTTPSNAVRPAHSRPPASRESVISDSSVSSSGSSFMDRMRQRYPDSSSSQTSLELEQDSPKDHKESQRQLRGKWTDGGDAYRDTEQTSKTEQDPALTSYVSYGSSIWNRITTATSSLAWSGSSTSGAVTLNGDSEVTRVLKAYYLNSARDRSDLPDWLFDEHERGVVKGSQDIRRDEDHVATTSQDRVAATRGKGLRDIYDEAAASVSTSRSSRRPADDTSSTVGSEVPGASKATNRLKALRDAKRRAATGGRAASTSAANFAEEHGRSASPDDYSGFNNATSAAPSSGWKGSDNQGWNDAKRMPPARVGLPTNPRRL